MWVFIFAFIITSVTLDERQSGRPPCPTNCICSGVLTKIVECNGTFAIADWRKLGEEIDIETTAQIEISYADFTYLELDDFPTIPSLMRLRILSGRIATFPKGLSVKFPELKYLLLQSQNIRYIPKSAFKGLTKVKNLDLAGNQLTRISAFNFEPLVGLQILNLNENRISCLDKSAFSGQLLLKFKFVSLKKNCLSVLPIGVFDSPTSFLFVNLEDNQIRTIRRGIFNPIFVLNLKNNRIQTIEDGAFNKFRPEAVNLQSCLLYTSPSPRDS